MNFLKKTLSVFLTVIILILSLSFGVSAEVESRFGRNIIAEQPRASLLLSAYDKIVEGCANAEKQITLSSMFSPDEKITEDELDLIFQAVVSDYPEYFWLTGGYDYTYNAISNSVFSVEPSYAMEGSRLISSKAALQAVTATLTSGLEGKSEYEKALILHDRLAAHVTYTETENDQTVYGALVEGKAVCAGYAKAYHYLLETVGVESWSVTGESISPTSKEKEGHRWSMAKINGNWCYIDVTWDDQESVTYPAYFGLSLSEMNVDHFPDTFKNYLPEGSNENNFFKVNGLVFSQVNTKTFISLFKANNNTIRIYIEGDRKAFEESLKANIEDIVVGLGTKGGSTYTYTQTYLGNMLQLSLIIESPNHKHKPSLVAGKAPTCSATGTKDYYQCSCGRRYYDSAAAQELSDMKTLIIDRTAHTPGEWQYNGIGHWKLCTVCGADIADMHGHHEDPDKDSICNTCSATFSEEDIKKSEKKTTYGIAQLLGAVNPFTVLAVIGVFSVVIIVVALVIKPKRR